MNSRTRPSFWRAYARLSEPHRQAARRAYALFAQNYEHVWSVRINEQYRAIGERTGDTIIWVWIGTHNDFDKLFG